MKTAKFKNNNIHPILNFRNQDISENADDLGNGYSLLTGTHCQDNNGKAYNYSTMMTRSREAVDSSEHAQS